MRLAGRLWSVLCLSASVASTACLTNALVTNLGDASCRSSVTTAISTMLVGQREPPELADRLASDAVLAMIPVSAGHGTFTVASPYGTDYTFVFRVEKEACLLRLYGRARGHRVTVNDLTYFATEPLPGCACVAGWSLQSRRHVGVHLR